jgi:hypothetical protein
MRHEPMARHSWRCGLLAGMRRWRAEVRDLPTVVLMRLDWEELAGGGRSRLRLRLSLKEIEVNVEADADQ